MNHFLLEIGTEELPAGYIDPALAALVSTLKKNLDEHRIRYNGARSFGTPRRLSVLIEDVAEKQTAVTEEILGPPERVGLDAEGSLLIPALKFAEKVGIDPNRLVIKKTDKGSYLAASITRKGISTKSILASLLPKIILSLPFPKTMRWADLSIHFARPIHTILALLGKDVIPFQLANRKSGRRTFGHRFMSPGKIAIASPENYTRLLENAYVIADVEKRKSLIENDVRTAAEEINGDIMPDEELLNVVTHLVEFPAVCIGTFDDRFLALPDEILITAMREHQKYFAVTDGDKLLPNFIVVNNTAAGDMKRVAKGHERVLRARLEDAMFFYENDLSAPFDRNIEKLKGVLFQADLGTMYDKTMRVEKLACLLADDIKADSGAGCLGMDNVSISRAATLCKADLVSQVVVEFPKLQGIMGRIYAENENEPHDVAAAIEEHYRPTFSGGPLPGTVIGAVIGIADKLDSICGCFSAGLIPSGASDPYGLRRQGIGLLQIIRDKGFQFSLMRIIEESSSLYNPNDRAKTDKTSALVYRFLKDRISHLMAEEGYEKDVIAAVTAVSIESVVDAWKKTEALQQLKQAPDYEPLEIAFKRVVNIIKKSAPKKTDMDYFQGSIDVNVDLFEDPCETDLYHAFIDVRTEVTEKLKTGDFDEALRIISSLRKPVDRFFDGVLVMDENESIRNNRLALLAGIAALFETIADFSKLSA
ncbi:MAG: glycine--tRNA ligase subunit beta [Desulfobacterales bacterium]